MADKYIIHFVREVSGVSQYMGKKRVNPSKLGDGVSFKGKTYVIDMTKPVMRRGTTYTYMIDMDKGHLTVGQGTKPFNTKLMDLIFRRELARQLVTGLSTTNGIKSPWFIAIMLIIGLGAGVALGYILGNYFPIHAPVVATPVSPIVSSIMGWLA